jgi:hypothetical protein
VNNKRKRGSVVLLSPFPFLLVTSLHGPASAANLTPRCSGILRVSNQANGVSMGYSAKLTRICGDKEFVPAFETLERNTVIVQTKEVLK